jgi:hypothetical protein
MKYIGPSKNTTALQLSDPLRRRCRKSREPVMLLIPSLWEQLECVYSRTHGSSTISLLVASIVAKLQHASSATVHVSGDVMALDSA